MQIFAGKFFGFSFVTHSAVNVSFETPSVNCGTNLYSIAKLHTVHKAKVGTVLNNPMQSENWLFYTEWSLCLVSNIFLMIPNHFWYKGLKMNGSRSELPRPTLLQYMHDTGPKATILTSTDIEMIEEHMHKHAEPKTVLGHAPRSLLRSHWAKTLLKYLILCMQLYNIVKPLDWFNHRGLNQLRHTPFLGRAWASPTLVWRLPFAIL